jgi:hypothetical protein
VPKLADLPFGKPTRYPFRFRKVVTQLAVAILFG